MEHRPPTLHPALVLTIVEGPITGEWCDRCMLPSVYWWRVTMSDRMDPTSIWWGGKMFECGDCGRRRSERTHGVTPPGVKFVA